MLPDVIISKISIIENCLRRIKQAGENKTLLDAGMILDMEVLNLQRAIQAVINIGNFIISENDYRTPNSYKMSFSILEEQDWIDRTVQEKMSKMIGFRNIAVHDYREINPDIVKSILKNHLSDFKDFVSEIIRKYEKL